MGADKRAGLPPRLAMFVLTATMRIL